MRKPSARLKEPYVLKEDDAGEYGPAMMALPEKMRAFVHHFIEGGGTNATKAYAMAGYGGPNKTNNSMQVGAHRMMHDTRTQAAIQEEALRKLVSFNILAVKTVESVLTDKKASNKDRMSAAKTVMDRAGLPMTTEHRVVVEQKLTYEQKLQKAIDFAKANGLEPAKLLASLGIEYTPFEEVEP